MAAFTLTVNYLHKKEMEYDGKSGHNIGRDQPIAIMSRMDIYYSTCCLSTQTFSPTLTGLQSIKRCVKYLVSHPRKPIFFNSYSYDGKNVIRIT